MLFRFLNFCFGRGTPVGGGGGTPSWSTSSDVTFFNGTPRSVNIASRFDIPDGYGTPKFTFNPGSVPSTGETLDVDGVFSYDGAGAVDGPVSLQVKAELEVVTVNLTSSVGGSGECCTFGHYFRKGDIPAGNVPTSPIPGFQSSVKTRYPNGSVAQAVIAVRSDFTASVPVAVSICSGVDPGGTPVAESLPSGTNTLSLSGIGTLTLSTLITHSIRTWMSGPVVSEYHYHAFIGSSTTVGAYVYLRNYANGKHAIKVVLHNGLWAVAGVDQVYTRAILTFGGAVVYDSVTELIIDHHTTPTLCANASGWHLAGTDPDIWPSHNVAYQSAAEGVLSYQPSTIASGTLNAFPQSYSPKTVGDVDALTAISSGTVTAYDSSSATITDSTKTATWNGGALSNLAFYAVSGTGAGTISRILQVPDNGTPHDSGQIVVVGAASFSTDTVYRIVDQNGLTASMGQLPGWHLGGGGDDASIGYLQRSCAAYAVTGDVRALKGMCVDAMASSAMYALHYPDESNLANGCVTWSAFADHQIAGSEGWPRPTASATPAIYFSGQYGGDWDLSHAYMPGAIAYMMTGDYAFLQALIDAANWNHFNMLPELRGHAVGYATENLQARGIGWANRNAGYAAALLPDDHPLKAQFVGAAGASASRLNSQQTNGLGLIVEPQNYGDQHGIAFWESDYAFVSLCMVRRLKFLTGQAAADLDALLTRMADGVVNRMGVGADLTKGYYKFSGPYRIEIYSDPWPTAPTPWNQNQFDANYGITYGRYFGFAKGSASALALDLPAVIMHSTGDENADRTPSNWTPTSSLDPWYDSYTYSALVEALNCGLAAGAQAAYNLYTSATNFLSSVASFVSDPRWGLGLNKSFAQNTASTTYVSASFSVQIAAPLPSGFGSGSDVGSFSAGVWTPGRDVDGLVNQASWDALVAAHSGEWIEVADTRIDQLDAVVKSVDPGWVAYGSSAWNACLTSWAGVAVDETDNLVIGCGGGHSNTSNFTQYGVNFWKMSPYVVRQPLNLSFTSTAYQHSGDGSFPAQNTFTSYQPAADQHAIDPSIDYDQFWPEFPNEPTARHTYGSLCIDHAGQRLFMPCRRMWVLDLVTKEWTVHTDPSGQTTGENMFAWFDEVDGKCYFTPEFFPGLGGGRSFNPSDGTFQDEPWIVGSFDAVYSAWAKVGRKVYAVVRPDSQSSHALPIVYVHNLDTKSTTSFTLTGVAQGRFPDFFDGAGLCVVPGTTDKFIFITQCGSVGSGNQSDLAMRMFVIDMTAHTMTDMPMTGNPFPGPNSLVETKLFALPALPAIGWLDSADNNMRIYIPT